MDFLELAKERYSVRDFKSDIVPKEIIDKILEAAYVSPTACNRQAFKITVVTSELGMEKFRKCTECHFDAPMAMIVSYDKDLSWDRPFDHEKSGPIDASIVGTHLMLEAYNLGVGSTWVMYFIPEAIIEEFELEENYIPVVVLPMGYPNDNSKPSELHNKFRNINELVEWR